MHSVASVAAEGSIFAPLPKPLTQRTTLMGMTSTKYTTGYLVNEVSRHALSVKLTTYVRNHANRLPFFVCSSCIPLPIKLKFVPAIIIDPEAAAGHEGQGQVGEY
jgi:hypothetical protein